mgnify:CR=1 FL=1
MKKLAVIFFTTRYKKGGDKFKVVAETISREKEIEGFETICQAIDSKQELIDLFSQIHSSKSVINELHFVGHSGMYGPMFGSKSYPQQFSPYELRRLNIPFSEEAIAKFHACRSSRWFAPYFSKVQNVRTYGYHWYTSFSKNKNRFKFSFFSKDRPDLYLIGCPGMKSHGILASAKKYLGIMKAEEWKEFIPTDEPVDRSYDEVANLYSIVFDDIKVRQDEYKWIMEHLPNTNNVSVLDIGCGNGALLKELNSRIHKGVGVDVSKNLIENAQNKHVMFSNLSFVKIDGPSLPFEDNSFDVVISLLSFRYLDWDPIIEEIQRVLGKQGKLIIIDMVTAPIKLWEVPQFIHNKVRLYLGRIKNPLFHKNLKKLVAHKDWQRMLNYNPIRSKHEMVWFLKSRFPNSTMRTINIGLHSRVIAFEATI